MGILEIIKARRSIRQFLDKPIPDKIVEELIEAAIWAPSAGNLQARKFYFVFNQETKNKLAAAAYGQNFIAQAPLAIVCCADLNINRHYGKRGTDLYTLQDVAASIQNMMLLAWEKGLGSVWVGAFDEISTRRILNLPNNLRPVAIVPVGYPAEQPSPPPRIAKSIAINTCF